MESDEQLRLEAERRISPLPVRAWINEQPLQVKLEAQEHELRVHQIELEIQNEELRRANLELETAHNRFADLFEFAPVGYVIFDETGTIMQINLAGCSQLGTVRQQLVGRRLSLFVETGQRHMFADLLQQVFRQSEHAGTGAGERQRAEVRMLRQDGSAWDAQLECVLLPGDLRPVARAVLTDISELKRAQREVERLNTTLEQQVERRTFQARQLHEELQTFVYSITHDMTRPLRQIQGFSELLGRSLDAPDQKSTRFLEHLKAATGQMNSQMQALLTFFQSSQPVNHRQQLNLNVLIDSIFSDLAPEMRDRQVQLTHDPLPTLEADLTSLRTVFSNLLMNAVKFTRPCAQASIHVGVQERGDTFLFSVTDNGVGFESRQSGRLFGVFQRLHSDRDFEGQGMGLALVRRIVQRYQGRVWAESVVGQGSIFWVQLPRNPATMLEEAESQW